MLLTGPDGTPATGLDADESGSIEFPGFPPLPVATFKGDGFGGDGPGGRRISIDCEGLVLGSDGSFWISDEYGPYIYKFSREGKLLQAIQPPDAYIPHRNGEVSFSAASAPIYDPERKPKPEETEDGRNNNKGFEGLTKSPDGKRLYVLLQSPTHQDSKAGKKHSKHTRVLEYDISGPEPQHSHEYAVTLPTYKNSEKKKDKDGVVASPSEFHLLPSGHFLILSRDSGFGRGQSESKSVYRHADIFAISDSTTDIKSDKYDRVGGPIASSKGDLKSKITPVEYCSFLDYNDENELKKFGLHNGGEQDSSLLNEKWESLAAVPVNPDSDGKETEYFLISFSDNDYITQNGMPLCSLFLMFPIFFILSSFSFPPPSSRNDFACNAD